MTVNKKKQSYSASGAELMFCKNNNSNSNNNNNSDDKISKMAANLNAMLEKEVEEEARGRIKRQFVMVMSAVAHERDKERKEKIEEECKEKIEKEYKEKEKRKKTQKKHRWIVISASLAWIIIIAFLFQYFSNRIAAIVGGFSSVIPFVISLMIEANSKNMQDVAHIRDKNESITTRIVKVGMAIIRAIKNESLLHFTFLLCVTSMLGVIIGSVGVIKNAKIFFIAGCNAVKNTDEDVILAIQIDEEVEEIILSGYDEKTINMLQKADITQAELNAKKKLSQEDYDLVFYLNQKDLDWTDRSTVNDAVSRMIDEKLSMQMKNVFDKNVNDGGAPQWLRDSVYQASEDEKTAESFSVILSIHNVRADAYEQYPKKSLANLISNDNQKLAIILYIKGGEEDSIVYYYGQSILRDFECLQFEENSDDTVKDKLISIAQRYKDMIYTCPNMKDRENAQVLAEAFENAANNY